MLKISDRLTFIFDPGHGWLRVPLADIAALGIEGDISECSFIDGRFAYHSARSCQAWKKIAITPFSLKPAMPKISLCRRFETGT